jgi:hypothetical protein
MSNKYIVTATLLFAAAAFGQSKNVALATSYAKYSSDLIGGEGDAGATMRFYNLVDVSLGLWTYQSTEGWQSWQQNLRMDAKYSKCSPLKIILVENFYMDMVDLRDRRVSPSLDTTTASRSRVGFAAGFGVDSARFFCRNCNYFVSANILIGDFIQNGYSSNYIPFSGETVSTAYYVDFETATPFGAFLIAYKNQARNYYGDETWRLSYKSPYCCNDMLRGTIGWENGFIGFASAELDISKAYKSVPMSLEFGVSIPNEASMWQWSFGISYHPGSKYSCTRKGHKSGGSVQAPLMYGE